MSNLYFPNVGLSITPEDWKQFGMFLVFNVESVDGGTETECEFEFDTPEGALNWNPEFPEFADLSPERCGCCNHKIKRGVFFFNAKTQQTIYVGFDCAKSIMKYSFNVEGAKKQTLKNRREKIKLDAVAKAFSENDGLEQALLDGGYNKILRDIRERLFKWGNISPKQVELVMKISAQRAEFVQVAKPLPIGKFEGELEVVSTKIVSMQTRYNWGTGTHYIQSALLKHPTQGWKVWVKNLSKNNESESDFKAKAGDRVSIKVTIEASEKDPYFGFGSRANWKLIEEPTMA